MRRSNLAIRISTPLRFQFLSGQANFTAVPRNLPEPSNGQASYVVCIERGKSRARADRRDVSGDVAEPSLTRSYDGRGRRIRKEGGSQHADKGRSVAGIRDFVDGIG